MSDPGTISRHDVEAARRGDEAALRRIVEGVYPRVRRWAFVHLGDADDAEDLTQDVMIRMIRKLGGFRMDSGFESWLYAMTRNAAHDRRRRDTRRRTLGRQPDVHAAVTPERAPSPDVVAAASETRERLLEALRALPERQREVFDLVELQGRSAADVAELLRIEPVSVRAHLFKARRSLRGAMIAHAPTLEESR